MTKFNKSDRTDQSVFLIEDAELDAVIGGATQNFLSPQLALAAQRVGAKYEGTFGDVVPRQVV